MQSRPAGGGRRRLVILDLDQTVWAFYADHAAAAGGRFESRGDRDVLVAKGTEWRLHGEARRVIDWLASPSPQASVPARGPTR